MKKIMTTIIILASTLFVLSGISSAATGAFTLSNGQVEPPPGDSEEYRIITRQLFSELTIEVSESGEVSGEAQFPFSFELSGDSYNGQASFKAKGTYDPDAKSIKGSFTYKHDRIKKHTFPSGNVTELEGSRNRPNFKFSGKAEGDSVKIEFTDLGVVTYAGVSPKDDEKDEESRPHYDLPDVEYQPGVDSGARFSSISRNVQMYPDGDPDDVRFATPRTVLEPGMHIFTGDDSMAVITFSDFSVLKLPPNSEIVIGPPSKTPSKTQILAGNLWISIKKIAGKEPLEVKSQLSTTGIKGTTIVLETTKDKVTQKVIEGTVSFTAKANGETTDVSSGEMVTADKNGLGRKTKFDVAAEQASWDTLEKKSRSKTDKLMYYVGIPLILVIAIISTFFIISKRKKKAE